MKMLIANTLRDIAEESALNNTERVSLRRIAKEVDALGDKVIKLIGIINMAILKCPSKEIETIKILKQVFSKSDAERNRSEPARQGVGPADSDKSVVE